MNICKSCGVTIHEEGKSFCPACEVSAKEAKEVGFTGDAPTAEKAELSLEDDTQRVSVLKLSNSSEKSGAAKREEKTGEEPGKKPDPPPASKPSDEDDRLSFSESPMNEGFAAPETGRGEPETLSAAIEKSGPKSYLTADERKALLSDLSISRNAPGRAAVKEVSAAPSSKPDRKKSEAAIRMRGPHPAADVEPEVAASRADKLPPTSVARGIAYFSGTHIHLVGGAHMASGEELVFKDRIYVLKEKAGAGGSRWVYLFPIVMLLMAGALLWVVSRPVPGGIAGLALDSRTRSTLPGAKIRLLEKGESAVTNEAGFFVLPKVPAGSYNIQAEGPGVEGNARVEVTKGGIAPIIVTLQPTEEQVLSQIPVMQPKPTPQTQPEAPPAVEPRLAGLNLSIEPSDAEAFLNGEPLGSGGIFKDLPSGRHTLVVKREGYQDWQNPVELKSGQANRVRVALVPKTVPTVSTAQPARKGFEDYLKEGENHLAKHDYPKAVTSLSEAIKIRPGSATALALLGEASWGNQDVKAGNNYFVKAARIYADQGSYPKAEELYLKVLEADPNLGSALMELGNLYVAMGDQEAARATYQDHAKHFSDSPDGFYALGRLEYQERRFKDAARAFEKALGSSTKPAMIHGYLILSHIQSNNKRKAQAAYDSFMKLATPSELATLKNHRDWSRVLAELSVRE